MLTEFADEAKVRGLKVHCSVAFGMIMTDESSILKEIEANYSIWNFVSVFLKTAALQEWEIWVRKRIHIWSSKG